MTVVIVRVELGGAMLVTKGHGRIVEEGEREEGGARVCARRGREFEERKMD